MPPDLSTTPFVRRPAGPARPDPVEARLVRGALVIAAGILGVLVLDAVLAGLLGARLPDARRHEVAWATSLPLAFVVRHWAEREPGPLWRTALPAIAAGVGLLWWTLR